MNKKQIGKNFIRHGDKSNVWTLIGATTAPRYLLQSVKTGETISFCSGGILDKEFSEK
jgi:hypothetical protein